MMQDAYILTVNMMKEAKIFFERKIIFHLIIAAAGIYLCIRYAAQCAAGIGKGIVFCIEVLIPSLYLFMVIAAYIVKSGAAIRLARPLEGIGRRMFRLPGAAVAAMLLAAAGGYPIGARCAAMLHEEGALSREQAQKTAYIAVAAGPGFCVNYIGAALLNQRAAGALLMAAQIIGMTVSGMLIGHIVSARSVTHRARPCSGGNNLLIGAVYDASKATFQMCSMVVIFSALTEIADVLAPAGPWADITSAILEITTGCNRMCGRYPLYIVAFFVGFGGLSVHFQIFAGLNEVGINKGIFLLSRLSQGIITMVAAYILLMIFPIKAAVFNTVAAPLTVAKSATLAGSAALMVSSLCFIGSIAKKGANE